MIMIMLMMIIIMDAVPFIIMANSLLWLSVDYYNHYG
jgi:hypothetical protein